MSELEDTLDKYRLMVDGAKDYISLIDRGYTYRAVNQAYLEAQQLTATEIIGRSVAEVWGEDTFRSFIQADLDRCFDGETVQYQASFEFRGMGLRYMDVTYYPCRDSRGGVTHAVIVNHDITELIRREKELNRLAYYDQLTSLPNRLQFLERLSLEISHAERDRTRVAVLFIDLDGFKKVNDLYGHHAGDELLAMVAQRLRHCFRKSDTITRTEPTIDLHEKSVSRLGGDEFTIIVPGLKDPKHIDRVANKVLDTLTKPFELAGSELFVTCSIGIAAYPDDGTDGETLLKNADTAMYRSKDNGKNGYAIYCPEMSDRVRDALSMENALQRAVRDGEFEVYYQPKVDVASGRVVGCEALARWARPGIGIVAAADFIPIAEETGLIGRIGQWILERACRDIVGLRAHGLELGLAVNFSARQLQDPALVDACLETLHDSGFNPSDLEIEITESMTIGMVDDVSEILRRFKEQGISIALDDFGTGYSSLTNLQQLPIDVLKIDRGFVAQMHEKKDSAILESIMFLAGKMALQVVAEGIETVEHRDFLHSIGCTLMQGYHFARPLPLAEFQAYVLAVNDTACCDRPALHG